MSTARSDRAAELERETLERQLAQMSLGTDDPLNLLGLLAGALFPAGVPDRDRLTWTEQGSTSIAPSTELDAEAKLRAAEARYRTLVEQIPAVTFLAVLGEGKNEIYVSPHIEQMLGFNQKEWMEAPFLWYWQLHPDDRQVLNDEFARGCRTGGPFKAECRFLARDGHVVWVHGEARLVKDELGRPSMLQGVAFDITESKRAQGMLLDKALRDAKMKEELAIAHRVQTSILPRTFDVPGLEIATLMIAADEVGGDYYDVLPMADGAWIGIGDVSGHGLDSGLVMLMAQSGMAALVRANPGATPAQLLVSLNDVLYENIRTRLQHDDHVTFSLLRYTSDGHIAFAGAHEDMLVWRKATGRVECVETKGTWLGGRKNIGDVTHDQSMQLQPGDLVVLYTDGVTEAMNQAHEQLELDRLVAALGAVGDQSCAQIRDHLHSVVRNWMWKQEDDLTMVVFRYHGNGTPAALSESIATTTKATPRSLVFTSRLDAPVITTPVVELSQRGASDRLSADGVRGERGLRLSLDGVAELPDRDDLRRLLDVLHRLAIASPLRMVELDLRPLKFLNSSCFKEILTWLAAIRALPTAQRYRVRVVANPNTRWQRASVQAICSFAQDLIDPETSEEAH